MWRTRGTLLDPQRSDGTFLGGDAPTGGDAPMGGDGPTSGDAPTGGDLVFRKRISDLSLVFRKRISDFSFQKRT